MPPASPFREEDLQSRVDALAIERDHLARAVATIAEGKVPWRRPWSWRRFLLGFCILPAAALLVIACTHLFRP